RSDFAFRTSLKISVPYLSATSAASSSWPIAPRSSASVGHGARCTDPSCHHDQTSSVTNGRNGANSRMKVDSAATIAELAEVAPAAPSSPYRRALTSSRELWQKHHKA